MSLKGIAKQTLQILDTGFIVTELGEQLSLEPALSQAVDRTRLYQPHQTEACLNHLVGRPGPPPAIEVTSETTQAAARRLVESESISDLVLLSFASARNPGGGFLNGAKAQEEDLSRCSGLYRCLLTQPAYYEANRANDSVLYTDHMIYSPCVPWFRTRSRDVPDTVFLASVITAPAPNAGVALQRDPHCGPALDAVLRRRAGMVLAVAAQEGHRNVLLGAWGCGVFRNNPVQVADAFGEWLRSERFAGWFDRVVFAVYDRTPQQGTLAAFQKQFSPWMVTDPACDVG
ncbi:MAG: TIGR02452 family protein [Blastocatellia bacterium]|nr:TIGR02452 family protein [Blastocatellia bacterium]